jgi:hypothetical protein
VTWLTVSIIVRQIFVKFHVGQFHWKNAVFWNVTPHVSCKNRCFGGTQRLYHQGGKNRWARNVRSNLHPMSVRQKAKYPADRGYTFLRKSVLIWVTRRNIQQDGILRSYPRESLKSYTVSLEFVENCIFTYLRIGFNGVTNWTKSFHKNLVGWSNFI